MTAVIAAMQRRARRWIWLGVLCLVAGVVVVAAGARPGVLAIVVGFVLVWTSYRWLGMLPRARASLNATPIDARVESSIYSIKGGRNTSVQLWTADPDSHFLASFSSSYHRSEPRLMETNMAPAKVYGTPVKGAVVTVTCASGVLVGRISRSRYGATRAARQIPGWLLRFLSISLTPRRRDPGDSR